MFDIHNVEGGINMGTLGKIRGQKVLYGVETVQIIIMLDGELQIFQLVYAIHL